MIQVRVARCSVPSVRAILIEIGLEDNPSCARLQPHLSLGLRTLFPGRMSAFTPGVRMIMLYSVLFFSMILGGLLRRSSNCNFALMAKGAMSSVRSIFVFIFSSFWFFLKYLVEA